MDFKSMLSELERNAVSENSHHDRSSKRQKNFYQESHTPPKPRLFPVEKVKEIFLACPPNIRTGGPEAMHQLCHKLNTLSESQVTASMLYIESIDGVARMARNFKPPSAYSIYSNIKVADSWNTRNCRKINSLIIWPECWTDLMDSFTGTHQNGIWWLSVDNNNGKFCQKHWKDRIDILHLYQSHYAKNYLMKNIEGSRKLQNVLPMTEFISSEATSDPAEHKRDIDILYNPLKGIHYTNEIQKRSEKHFNFVPIGGREKLSPNQVSRLLRRGKIYVDFGHHPGMDRLPREAAISNCIVITNRAGAANFEEDIPIPSEYKFGEFDVDKIHILITNCIQFYDERIKDFDMYREWIQNQEKVMDECVQGFLLSVNKNRGIHRN